MTQFRQPIPQIGSDVAAPFLSTGTFLKAQRQTDLDVDVALLGVPFDQGTFGRDGSRYAPAQIREYSLNIKPMHFVTRLNPFEEIRIADVGDVEMNPFDPAFGIRAIEEKLKDIRKAGAAPLAVGGDHTISYPILKGLVSPEKPISCIQIDAHIDMLDEFAGSRINHTTPFRRSIEDGLIDPTRHIVVGLRGTLRHTEAIEWALEQGVHIYTIEDFYEQGPKSIAHEIKEIVGGTETYLTFDIDGLDPIVAPGTGSPEPGGMMIRETQVFLRELSGINFIGGDVNEVCPPLDTTGFTALHAAQLMFEMLCLLTTAMLQRRAGGAG